MGVFDIGRGRSVSLTSNLASGITAVLRAAMPAKAKASKRLPSSETANKSRMTCHAFSPGMIQRPSTSMHPDIKVTRFPLASAIYPLVLLGQFC